MPNDKTVLLTYCKRVNLVRQKIMEKIQLVSVTIKVTPSYLLKLDDWRRKKSPLPSRSEAIRTLTAEGLKK